MAAKKANSMKEKLDRLESFVSSLQEATIPQQLNERSTSSSTPLHSLVESNMQEQINTVSLPDLELQRYAGASNWHDLVGDVSSTEDTSCIADSVRLRTSKPTLTSSNTQSPASL